MEQSYDVHLLQVGAERFRNYNYIITDKYSNEAVIIDPAWDLNLILGQIRRLNVNPTSILLTHSHDDHVNLVRPLLEYFDAKVYMSAAEIDYYSFDTENLVPFQDMDEIRLGRTLITCLVTPGHTAGGACFLLAGHLFSGDTLFTEGCGICNAPGGSADEMFNSIQRIKHIVPPHVCVYPGHSYGEAPGYTLGYLLQSNIYLLIDDKEVFINFRMRKNQQHILRLS